MAGPGVGLLGHGCEGGEHARQAHLGAAGPHGQRGGPDLGVKSTVVNDSVNDAADTTLAIQTTTGTGGALAASSPCPQTRARQPRVPLVAGRHPAGRQGSKRD